MVCSEYFAVNNISSTANYSLTASAVPIFTPGYTGEPVLSGHSWEWLSDRLIQDDRLIQVVKNTGQKTVKMPFHIMVNGVVYSLCKKLLKNSFG